MSITVINKFLEYDHTGDGGTIVSNKGKGCRFIHASTIEHYDSSLKFEKTFSLVPYVCLYLKDLKNIHILHRLRLINQYNM